MVELKLFHKFLIFIAVIISLLRLSRDTEPKIKKNVVKPILINARQSERLSQQQISQQQMHYYMTQQQVVPCNQSHKLIGTTASLRAPISIPDAAISEEISDTPDRLLF